MVEIINNHRNHPCGYVHISPVDGWGIGFDAKVCPGDPMFWDLYLGPRNRVWGNERDIEDIENPHVRKMVQTLKENALEVLKVPEIALTLQQVRYWAPIPDKLIDHFLIAYYARTLKEIPRETAQKTLNTLKEKYG